MFINQGVALLANEDQLGVRHSIKIPVFIVNWSHEKYPEARFALHERLSKIIWQKAFCFLRIRLKKYQVTDRFSSEAQINKDLDILHICRTWTVCLRRRNRSATCYINVSSTKEDKNSLKCRDIKAEYLVYLCFWNTNI